MKFEPYYDKIVIKPIKEKDPFTDSDTQAFQEMGEVIAVGSMITYVQPGDTLIFDSWGCSKTPEIDGEVYYVVTCSSEVVIGKIEKKDDSRTK